MAVTVTVGLERENGIEIEEWQAEVLAPSFRSIPIEYETDMNLILKLRRGVESSGEGGEKKWLGR